VSRARQLGVRARARRSISTRHLAQVHELGAGELEPEPVPQQLKEGAEAERADREPLDRSLREQAIHVDANMVGERGPDGLEEANRFAARTPKRELEHQRGGPIEPLEVVDRDDHRARCGERPEAVENAEPDGPRVRGRARRSAPAGEPWARSMVPVSFWSLTAKGPVARAVRVTSRPEAAGWLIGGIRRRRITATHLSHSRPRAHEMAVDVRITYQTTERGDLCCAHIHGLGDHSAATALASNARASREPTRTLAPRPGAGVCADVRLSPGSSAEREPGRPQTFQYRLDHPAESSPVRPLLRRTAGPTHRSRQSVLAGPERLGGGAFPGRILVSDASVRRLNSATFA
jgi:hypothetical protein